MSDLPIGTVEFSGVSKRYRLGGLGTLRGALASLGRRGRGDSSHEIWALKDVSFRIEPGSALGLIGPNGAGKTTALKLLSSITQPTSGRVRVSGRVSSLIELGAGFHPELSGRENIFLNGAILGLSRREIRSKLDKIIAFSELERFIDTPVKRYSSGMYVRLGFAVAAHVEPDVLLVDEVLAVGDASFRQRCVEHMQALRRHGTTVVFVSHNMHLVRSTCSAAILLVAGRTAAMGSSAEVISAYEQLLMRSPTDGCDAETAASAEHTLLFGPVQVVQAGAPISGGILESQRGLTLHIPYVSLQPQHIGRIDVRILRDDGTLCCTADSSQTGNGTIRKLEGEGAIELEYLQLQLTSGMYTAVIQVTDVSDTDVIASTQSSPFQVHAEGSGRDRGVFVPQVNWRKTL
jgi:lipopolysaccharide transport system ATP-binding protein